MSEFSDLLGEANDRRREREQGLPVVDIMADMRSPDEAAAERVIADEVGQPPQAVRAYPELFGRSAEVSRTRRQTESTPRLQQWLADQNNFAVARDDVENLSVFERARASHLRGDHFRALGPVGDFLAPLALPLDPLGAGAHIRRRTAEGSRDPFGNEQQRQGDLDVEQSMLGYRRGEMEAEGADLSPEDLARLDELAVRPGRDDWGPFIIGPTRRLIPQLVGQFRQGGEAAGAGYSDVMDRAIFNDYAGPETREAIERGEPGAVTGALARSAAASPLAAIVGAGHGLAGFYSFGFEMETGSVYDEMRRSGIEADIAWPRAQEYGAWATALEFAGDALGAKLSGAGRLAARTFLRRSALQASNPALRAAGGVAGGAVAEGPTEAAQQLAQIIHQDLAQQETAGGDADVGAAWRAALTPESIEQILHAGYIGAQGGGGMAVVPSSVNYGLDIRAAQRAEQNATTFEEWTRAAQASKLSERGLVSTLESAVGAMDDSSVYIDADQFLEHFQGANANPYTVADELGFGAENLAQAVASHGQVRLPTSTFAARVLRLPEHAKLAEHARISPTDMTPAEAKMADAVFQSEVETLAAEVETAQSDNEIGQIVETRMRELFAVAAEEGGPRSAVSARYAKLVAAMPRALLARARATNPEYAQRLEGQLRTLFGENLDIAGPAREGAAQGAALEQPSEDGQNGDQPLGSDDGSQAPQDYQARLERVRSRFRRAPSPSRAGEGPAEVGGVREDAGASGEDGRAGSGASQVRSPQSQDRADVEAALSVSGIRIVTKPKVLGQMGDYLVTIDLPEAFAPELDGALTAPAGAPGRQSGFHIDYVDGSNPQDVRLPGVYLRSTSINDAAKNTRAGIWLYRQIIDWAHRKGLPAFSDFSISPEAQHIYPALERRGYRVTQINPYAGDPDDGAYVNMQMQPIFRIDQTGEETDYAAADIPDGDYQIDGPSLRERVNQGELGQPGMPAPATQGGALALPEHVTLVGRDRGAVGLARYRYAPPEAPRGMEWDFVIEPDDSTPGMFSVQMQLKSNGRHVPIEQALGSASPEEAFAIYRALQETLIADAAAHNRPSYAITGLGRLRALHEQMAARAERLGLLPPGYRYVPGDRRASARIVRDHVAVIEEAHASGYTGQDTGEAAEWVRARDKGLPMDEASRMARAEEQGFTVKAFRGIADDAAPSAQGEFYSAESATASGYAEYKAAEQGDEGANVRPVLLRTGDFRRVRFIPATEPGGPNLVDEVVRADQRNEPGLIIDGVPDVSGRETQFYVRVPTNIRSIHAAFDPDYRDSADLLAQEEAEQGEARGSIRYDAFKAGEFGEAVIRLGEASDLSTFLHEFGHLGHLILESIATDPEAPAEFKAMWENTLQWWGVTQEEWSSFAPEQKVEHFERWARTFEAYLMEGKAPSLGLREAFAAFKEWLKRIYTSILRLDHNLNPEIRDVFDRLLATDAEMAEARAAQGADFALAREAFATEEEFVQYQQAISEARDAQEAELRARVMDAHARKSKRWWRGERERMRPAAARHVDSDPARRAEQWLGAGEWRPLPETTLSDEGETGYVAPADAMEEMPEGLPEMRLSAEALAADWPDAQLPLAVAPRTDVEATLAEAMALKAVSKGRGPARAARLWLFIKNNGGINLTGLSEERRAAFMAAIGSGQKRPGLINNKDGKTPEELMALAAQAGYFGKGAARELRQFGGQRARTANMRTLDEAKRRVDGGEDAARVRRDTGWFRGPDGKWRFEIADTDAQIKVDLTKPFDGRMADFLGHPDLFEAYPTLADVHVQYDANPYQLGGGSYFANTNAIVVESAQGARSVTLHEIQHWIQELEGFARGSAQRLARIQRQYPERYRQEFAQRWSAAMKRLSFWRRLSPQERRDEALLINRDLVLDGYEKSGGEVEARDVEARAAMSREERSATPPAITTRDDLYLEEAFLTDTLKGAALSERQPPTDPSAPRAPEGMEPTLRVYHGTSVPDQFETPTIARSQHADGTWVSDDPSLASQFARGEGGRVLPLDLRGRIATESDVTEAWTARTAKRSFEDILRERGFVAYRQDGNELIVINDDALNNALAPPRAPEGGGDLEQGGELFSDKAPNLEEFMAALTADLKNERQVFSAKDPEALASAQALSDAQAWFDSNEIDLTKPKEEIRADIVAALERARNDPNALHADDIAPWFSFSSGDELIQALSALKPRAVAIEDRIDSMVEEEHGDAASPDKIQEAARLAAHVEAQSRRIEMELAALQKATGGRARPVGRAARKYAEQQVSRMSVREVRGYEKFLAGERRAARNAAEAKDPNDAAMWKQRQLISFHMYRFARDAAEEMDKFQSYARKFERDTIRANIHAPLLDQIDQALEGIDLRRTPRISNRRRQNFLAWYSEMQAEGLDHMVAVDPAFLTEVKNRPFASLTVEEARGLRDAIKNFEHIGRRWREVLSSRGKRLMEEAVTEMVDAIDANGQIISEKRKGFSPDTLEYLNEQRLRFHAEHTKPEFLFRLLDGLKDSGPVWRNLFAPIARAEDAEMEMRNDAAARMTRVFSAYSRTERGRLFVKKRFITAIGRSMTKAEILSVALNWGNEGNRQALVEGYQWNDQQVRSILDELDQRDWQVVKDIWAWIEEYREPSFALQERLTGVRPAAVEGMEVATNFGPVQGAYYPLRYDPEQGERAFRREEQSKTLEEWGSNWIRPQTRQGHLQARVGSGGQKVRLDLSVLTEHVENVIHDITHREAVIGTLRFIENKRLQEAMIAAVGRQQYRQLRPWLSRIAADVKDPSTVWERVLLRLRMGASVVNMGWKITTAIVQPLGLLNSLPRVGGGALAKALINFYAQPHKMREAVGFVFERSTFMKNRMATFDRDVRDAINRIRGKAERDAIPVGLRQSFFWMTGVMDMSVSVPTWLAAYDNAMSGKVDNIAANEPKAAAEHADSVVRTTQGAGGVKDLTGYTGSKREIMRLFTMFYSYMSNLYNQLYVEQAGGLSGGIVPPHVFIGNMFVLWFLPAVGAIMLQGRWEPDDDETDEERLRRLGLEVAAYPLFTMVGVRDIVNGVITPYDYTMTPVSEALERTVGAGRRVVGAIDNDGAIDEDELRGIMKDMTLATGYWLAIPARQLWITGEYLTDVATGDEAPPWEDPEAAYEEGLLRDRR